MKGRFITGLQLVISSFCNKNFFIVRTLIPVFAKDGATYTTTDSPIMTVISARY